MQAAYLYRPPQWQPRLPRRLAPLTKTAPLAGFDFHTASGLIFGDLAGALTSLARQSTVDMTVQAYPVAGGALVASSGTLTTDSNGRLARWEHASLAAATAYHLIFVRSSDGEIACAKLTTT